MSDPTTSNILLAVPTRGSDPGTWDTPVNNNSTALDGYFGGVQNVSVSGGSVTLTCPAGVVTPSAGPTQAQNAVIRLTGNAATTLAVVLPLPGYYIFDTNGLTVSPGALVFVRTPSFTEIVAVPIGQVMHLYNDGTNVRFVDLPAPGVYWDYAGSAVPIWISNCTKPPFLLCDGSTFNGSTYPVLAGILGTTVLPDFRGSAPYYVNGGTGRLTSAGAGIDGNTLSAAGGNNGVLLSVNQVPAGVSSVNAAQNIVVTGPNGHTVWIDATSTSVPSTGGALQIPGGGAASNTVQFSGSNSITVLSTNASQAIVGSTTHGTVAGIRMIRAA